MANEMSELERQEYEEAILRLKVASRIEVLAEDTGVTRTELARRLGRSKPWVSKLLSGRQNLTLDSLSRIGWALGVRWETRPVALDDRHLSPAANDKELPDWVVSSHSTYVAIYSPAQALVPEFFGGQSYIVNDLVGPVHAPGAPRALSAEGSMRPRSGPWYGTEPGIVFVSIGTVSVFSSMALASRSIDEALSSYEQLHGAYYSQLSLRVTQYADISFAPYDGDTEPITHSLWGTPTSLDWSIPAPLEP